MSLRQVRYCSHRTVNSRVIIRPIGNRNGTTGKPGGRICMLLISRSSSIL